MSQFSSYRLPDFKLFLNAIAVKGRYMIKVNNFLFILPAHYSGKLIQSFSKLYTTLFICLPYGCI